MFVIFLASSRPFKNGLLCTKSSECKSQFCCEDIFGAPGYCSSCCVDSDCGTGDVCALRADADPSNTARACFRKNGFPISAICSRNDTCVSGYCNGGSENKWNVTIGVCSTIVQTPSQITNYIGEQ